MQFATFVSKALLQGLPASRHRYLVADASTANGRDMTIGLPVEGTAIDILTGEPCTWRDCASPVLLELRAQSISEGQARRVEQVLERWRHANAFTYIESGLDAHQMRRALHARTEALLTQDMSVMLRFFDSRVLEHLLAVLTPNQGQAFLSAGATWAYPDRHGRLKHVQAGATADTFVPPLKFDARQEALLIEAGEVDALVGVLLGEEQPTLGAMSPPEQHERVSAALVAASNLGLDQLHDQKSFCKLSLELGADFYEQAPWSEWVAEMKHGKLTFAAVTAMATKGSQG